MNTGLKLKPNQRKSFAGRVAVYQPSLFGDLGPEITAPETRESKSPVDTEPALVSPVAIEPAPVGAAGSDPVTKPPATLGEQTTRADPATPAVPYGVTPAEFNALAVQEFNALIHCQYNMTLYERRLFVKIIERLPEAAPIINGEAGPVSVTLAPGEIMAGGELEGKAAMEELENATAGLIGQVCWVSTPQGRLQVGLASSARFAKDASSVTIRVDPALHPYLLRMKGYFSLQEIAELINYKSFYSKAFYDLFGKLPLPRGSVYYPLPELRRLLLIEDQYHRYPDVKRFVIEKAQKDLVKTPVAFTFEEKRNMNNQVLGVKFTFTEALLKAFEPLPGKDLFPMPPPAVPKGKPQRSATRRSA